MYCLCVSACRLCVCGSAQICRFIAQGMREQKHGMYVCMYVRMYVRVRVCVCHSLLRSLREL